MNAVNPRKLMETPDGYAALLLGAGVLAATPFFAQSDYWMGVLATTGFFAMAAIGLSLLTGYAGQVSLGHAAFLTIGGYAAGYFGVNQDWPFLAWLTMAGIIGGLIGLLLGPFSLRFRGNYLVVITLALIFVSVHVVENWDSVTGGHNGTSTGSASLSLGFVDFANLSIFGKDFTREQGIFYLAWIMVGITALIARNIVRSRPGLALQAIRDRDLASEVLGINNTRFKISVFVLSSAIATMAGAVSAVQLRFISPPEPLSELFVSIRFLAIIVVGGLGTVYGSIVGALLLVPFPELIDEFSAVLDFTVPFLDRPFVSNQNSRAIFSVAAFNDIIYSILLILFLIFLPHGISGLFRRLQIKIRSFLATKIRT